MTDYESFSSIPDYNKFRFTANFVDTSDLIALAVKMPRDFRFWFVGAFSAMLDIDAWKTANGITAETMTEIANNDVIFGEFCEFVADCITNDAAVQNALQQVSGATAYTIIEMTNYSNTVLITENADANGCSNDAKYGRIDALIDYIDQVQLDFYESIDAATSVLGEVANLVSAIPILETLPLDEAIATIADTGEQWEDSYTASVNTQLLEDFKCELFCATSSCDVRIGDVRRLIEQRYNIDTSQGLLNALSATALLARIATTVGSAGGLTYIGDDFVFLSWLLQILAVETSGEFFGVEIVDYVTESANGTSGAWASCQNCTDWTQILLSGTGSSLITVTSGTLASDNSRISGAPISGNQRYVNAEINFPQATQITEIVVEFKISASGYTFGAVANLIYDSAVQESYTNGNQNFSASPILDTGAINESLSKIVFEAQSGFGAVDCDIVRIVVSGTGTNPF